MSKSTSQTISEFLEYIGTILNDDDKGKSCGLQWPLKARFNALKEALCRLREMRPDAFSEKIEVPLVAGQMQEIPDGYERILSINANSDGSKISDLDQRASTFNDQIAGLMIGCRASSGGVYSASSAEVDTNNATSFCVTPAVSQTQSKDATVWVTVIKDADCIELTDCIPGQFKAALVEWVLYRMYSFETDSSYLLNKSASHRNTFDQIVDKEYRYRSAQNSGYWLGSMGAGDPASRAP